jgi:hypothetical protein|eukprot:Stramenopile-MAST_4_protein_1499
MVDLGSHFNPVQANQIWSETLKKENKSLKFSENFRVNPKAIALSTVTPKPQSVNPFALAEKLRTTDPSQDSAADPEVEKIMKEAARPPQEKYKFPQTGGQAIGWSWKDGVEEYEIDRKWRATHAQSEIVSYVDNYVLSFGKSPYCKQD